MTVDWPTLISGGIAGAIIKATGDVIATIIRKKKSNELTPAEMTVQFSALLKASEGYRTELRQDLDRMKSEFENGMQKYEEQISIMKNNYEKEISELRKQVQELIIELNEYRQENGALHLILKQQDIQIPNWIKRSTER